MNRKANIVKHKKKQSTKAIPRPLITAYSEIGGDSASMASLLRTHGDYLFLMYIDACNELMLNDEFWEKNEMQRLNETRKALALLINDFIEQFDVVG